VEKSTTGLVVERFEVDGASEEKKCYSISVVVKNTSSSEKTGSIDISESASYWQVLNSGAKREVRSPMEAFEGQDTRPTCNGIVPAFRQTITVPPGESKMIDIETAHDWDWIEKPDAFWNGISLVRSVLSGGLLLALVDGVIELWEAVDLVYEAVDWSPTAKYTYTLKTTDIEVPKGTKASKEISVKVAPWKVEALKSTLKSMMSGYPTCTIAGLNRLIGPFICLAHTYEGISAYEIAYDPDVDFETLVEPEPADVSKLSELPDGLGRDCGLAALESMSFIDASKRSAFKAAAARDAGNDTWYATQLVASQRFMMEASQRYLSATACLSASVAALSSTDELSSDTARILTEGGIPNSVVAELQSASAELAPEINLLLANNAEPFLTSVLDLSHSGTAELARALTIMYTADFTTDIDGWKASDDDSTWSVTSSELRCDGNNADRGRWAAAPFALGKHTHYAIETEISLPESACQSGANAGVVIRRIGATDGPSLKIDTCENELWLMDASAAYSPGADWHTYRIEVRDNHYRVLVDGAFLLEATGLASLTGGNAGLFSISTPLAVRRFEISAIGELGDATDTITVEPVDEEMQSLAPRGSLAVHVFDCPSAGSAADQCSPHSQGIEVLLTNAAGESVTSGTTNSEGTFEIDSLAEGAYWIELSEGDWCRAEASSVNDEGLIVVDASSTTQVNIFLCNQ
jgi:hypothetical protein